MNSKNQKPVTETNAEKKSGSNNLEERFDAAFATTLALKEKQIQQNYRPIIGIHKWFARRPGTIFRSLLLSEFDISEPVSKSFWKAHKFKGVIADPFMGGGTPTFEANRLGFHTVGTDINPMAYWIVRQSLVPLDLIKFRKEAEAVISEVEKTIGQLYKTDCAKCNTSADVKYFLWVKTSSCPKCFANNDLFPGYLIAENKRHPKNVILCRHCGSLNEKDSIPTADKPSRCGECKKSIFVEGTAKKQHVSCNECSHEYKYLDTHQALPLKHRPFALEYHCEICKSSHKGRFFKKPDENDLRMIERSSRLLKKFSPVIPSNDIPEGDETGRLHKWGYRWYRDMFNDRQLLGLGLLLGKISEVKCSESRYALLTVFSDILRYQNMLCRYDTYALKCQDIFSVHGFPVGLVQCENNILGIPKIGSGAFRHFVEKYIRAKEYCVEPFETLSEGGKKKTVPIIGETIFANVVEKFPNGRSREAQILAVPSWDLPLPQKSLDGVFTDPPYFDNVQYAELMDFCFAWLRLGLKDDFEVFNKETTRAPDELTGNASMGRGLEHFTAGLSRVFSHYAAALKENAPFVFTYHHNDPEAYMPLVVAILDAGLNCTATLPAAAEMAASLHIAGTKSSVLFDICKPTLEKRKITADRVSTRL